MDRKAMLQLQVYQLERLIKLKRVKFEDAIVVIFSDYIDFEYYKMLRENTEISPELRSEFNKYICKRFMSY